MEKLFVYAILCGIGYEKYNDYKDTLDQLFENNPDDEQLLDLENRKYKDAMLHIHALMNVYPIDYDKFGKYLMNALKPIYKESAIDEFGNKMYKLWNRLPASINNEDPFFVLNYADDCLSYGDEEQCRELYESMLNYYDVDE